MVLLGFSVYCLCTLPHFVLSTWLQHNPPAVRYWREAPKGGLNLQPESLSRTINRFGQGEKGTCLSPECEVSAFD